MQRLNTGSGRAYLYVALVVCGWATAASAFKLALKTLDFAQVVCFASLGSWLVLTGVLLVQGKGRLVRRQGIRQVELSALQGLLNPCAYYLILLQAYSRLPAQVAMAINYTWPLVLAILAVPILGQPLRGRTLAAIGISLIGILLIATGGELSTLQARDPGGVILAFVSTGLWALYWLASVRDQRDGVVKLWMGFGFGSFYTLILLPLLSTPRWPTWMESGLSLYIGTAEMGLTFVFWLRALELADDKGAIANFAYLAPFLSLVLIAVVLQEAIQPASIVGLVLIISGILWQSQPKPVSPS